jgi:phytoene desaturase
MMNYADLVLGTWYPMGGMHGIVTAMTSLAVQSGAENSTKPRGHKDSEVIDQHAKKALTADKAYEADIVVAGSDYRHTEQCLLSEESRVYSREYWDKRTMSPPL